MSKVDVTQARTEVVAGSKVDVAQVGAEALARYPVVQVARLGAASTFGNNLRVYVDGALRPAHLAVYWGGQLIHLGPAGAAAGTSLTETGGVITINDDVGAASEAGGLITLDDTTLAVTHTSGVLTLTV